MLQKESKSTKIVWHSSTACCHKTKAMSIRMTLSWFRFFLNTVSSHWAYQSFNIKVDLEKTYHFWAWGNLRQKTEESRKTALGIMIPPTGFTSGIYATPRKHWGHCSLLRTLWWVTSQVAFTTPIWGTVVSTWIWFLRGVAMTQDVPTVMLGSFPELVAKEGWRGLVIKTSEMTTQTQPGFRGPERAERLGQAGSTSHPKHCLGQRNGTWSPSHEYQPARPRKQDTLSPKIFPSIWERNWGRLWGTGNMKALPKGTI